MGEGRRRADRAVSVRPSADVAAAALGTQNLLVPMRKALHRVAELGEVSDVLRKVFGVYQPS